MGRVGHEHLRFAHVAQRVLGEHFLMELFALALHLRVALHLLVLPFDFIFRHHMVLGVLPFLKKIVHGGDDAEDARRHEQQVFDSHPEDFPHGPDRPPLDGEQRRQMIPHDNPDSNAEHRHLDDVLEELHKVLHGENLLEPFGRAYVFELGHGSLEGEQYAHLSEVGDEGHGHDEADERGDDRNSYVERGFGGARRGLGVGRGQQLHGKLHHRQQRFQQLPPHHDNVDGQGEHGQGRRHVLAFAHIPFLARFAEAFRCWLFGFVAHGNSLLSCSKSALTPSNNPVAFDSSIMK